MFKWGLFSWGFVWFFSFPSGKAGVFLLTEEIGFTIKQYELKIIK